MNLTTRYTIVDVSDEFNFKIAKKLENLGNKVVNHLVELSDCSVNCTVATVEETALDA